MEDKVVIGRRAMLLGAGPVTAAALLATGTPAQGRNGDSYAPAFFTASEWAFINAAVDRLIPSIGDGPGGVECGVPEFIDRQLELPYGHGAFFAQLLENTKEGYFADPLYGGNRGMAAWKWIGFPGARADFTDWLDQAGRAYPYGPVSISGRRG